MKKFRMVDTDRTEQISPGDAVRYTQELVDSLKEIALQQNHLRLAELLDAASAEAARLAASLSCCRDSSFR
jgi:hypothetical protein